MSSMLRFIILCFLVFLGFLNLLSAQSRLDSLIRELDQAIELESETIARKQSRIDSIKMKLTPGISSEEKYQVFTRLALEYQVFVSDSAAHYAKNSIELAEQLGDPFKQNEGLILLAATEAKTGMFPIALDLLKKVDDRYMGRAQRIDYLKTLSEVYIYWMEYQQGHESDQLHNRRNELRDSLIAILPKNSMEYAVNKGTLLIEERRWNEAEALLKNNFQKGLENTRNYSIYTSILAYLYESKGDRTRQMEELARSALSDVRGSIMENLSLRTLALKLYEQGDLERANYYIKKSLRDANFFNARLRNLQISRILPIIDEAYEVQKQKQENRLRILLIVVTLLSLILALVGIMLLRQMRKVVRARKEVSRINEHLSQLNLQLSSTNQKLSESNRIKEQYIHSFLEMCTEYIERLENFKRIVSGKLRSGQSAEILKIIDSSQLLNEELKELYKNFDKAFLKVYPDFVEKLNELLKEEERYVQSSSLSLNHELRPLALVRLGVTENAQIATFLHYSLRTVYNYRSKVKNKAKDPQSFEEKVQHISGFSS